MLKDSLALAKGGRDQALADLLEFLAIPSVSSLPGHDPDTRRACDWTADRLRRMGMTVEVVEVPGGRHPVISAEWLGRPGKPTLAIYGDYDVQPPALLAEWLAPPCEPGGRAGTAARPGAGTGEGGRGAPAPLPGRRRGVRGEGGRCGGGVRRRSRG